LVETEGQWRMKNGRGAAHSPSDRAPPPVRESNNRKRDDLLRLITSNSFERIVSG
jgi:hypothetical protein